MYKIIQVSQGWKVYFNIKMSTNIIDYINKEEHLYNLLNTHKKIIQ